MNVFPKKNGLLDQTCLTYLFSQRERDEDSIQAEKDAFFDPNSEELPTFG